MAEAPDRLALCLLLSVSSNSKPGPLHPASPSHLLSQLRGSQDRAHLWDILCPKSFCPLKMLYKDSEIFLKLLLTYFFQMSPSQCFNSFKKIVLDFSPVPDT